MEDRKKLYQVFVIVTMLVLLTGGIFIGMAISKNNVENENENANIQDKVEEVSNKNIEVYNKVYEDKEEDVQIVYVDIYKDCNHREENKSNEYGVNFENVKERELSKIEKEKSGYKMVKSEDGVLMFEKVYDCKCQNHYMLKFDGEVVAIYRYNENGEYEKYQDTDIQKEGIRPDLSFRLSEGIEAETLEELYMFLEELES